MARGVPLPPQSFPGFCASADFRTVVINDEEYQLTGRQAQIVEFLYDQFRQGTPAVGQDRIMVELGSPDSRFRDAFQNNREAEAALIAAGHRRGTVRLNLFPPTH